MTNEEDTMTIEVKRRGKDESFNILDLSLSHRECDGGLVKIREISIVTTILSARDVMSNTNLKVQMEMELALLTSLQRGKSMLKKPMMTLE